MDELVVSVIKPNQTNKSYEEVIQDLSDECDVVNLLSFNEINIQDKLFTNAAKVQHYTELYYREKNDYDKIIEIKEALIGKKFEYYKTNADLLLKQSEIEKYYLPRDPDIMRITSIARQQKWRVDFYWGLKGALEKQGWNMMNYLKSMQVGL